ASRVARAVGELGQRGQGVTQRVDRRHPREGDRDAREIGTQGVTGLTGRGPSKVGPGERAARPPFSFYPAPGSVLEPAMPPATSSGPVESTCSWTARPSMLKGWIPR